MNFDGVGTKVELAERLQTYRGLARDLFAMVCDDAACQGAEPILVGSILDMARVDIDVVKEIAGGMVDAARIARVAVINGELAELPDRICGVGASPLNWGASCLWAATVDKLKHSEKPSPGDVLIGIEERGFRSNGFSLLRAIFSRAYGATWGTQRDSPGADLIRYAAQPSTIYTPFLLSLTGGLEASGLASVKALIHVTGGGIQGRLRFFCQYASVGIQVHSPLSTPEEVREIVSLGDVEIDEAYRTWNMGTGLVVIVPESQAEAVLNLARVNNLNGRITGSITEKTILNITRYDGSTYSESLS
jgi:phosphoribosylformylglycinamidine cyclo-ligase